MKVKLTQYLAPVPPHDPAQFRRRALCLEQESHTRAAMRGMDAERRKTQRHSESLTAASWQRARHGHPRVGPTPISFLSVQFSVCWKEGARSGSTMVR